MTRPLPLTCTVSVCLLLLAGMTPLMAEEKPTTATPPAKTERLKPEEWCTKHDVPKSVDGACERKLIPALKKEKDWCAEHDKAESVCVECDPSAKARLDALRPAGLPVPAKP
jgi:hypothetical protein